MPCNHGNDRTNSSIPTEKSQVLFNINALHVWCRETCLTLDTAGERLLLRIMVDDYACMSRKGIITVSKVRLARESGLKRDTVIAMIRKFVERGLFLEDGKTQSGILKYKVNPREEQMNVIERKDSRLGKKTEDLLDDAVENNQKYLDRLFKDEVFVQANAFMKREIFIKKWDKLCWDNFKKKSTGVWGGKERGRASAYIEKVPEDALATIDFILPLWEAFCVYAKGMGGYDIFPVTPSVNHFFDNAHHVLYFIAEEKRKQDASKNTLEIPKPDKLQDLDVVFKVTGD